MTNNRSEATLAGGTIALFVLVAVICGPYVHAQEHCVSDADRDGITSQRWAVRESAEAVVRRNTMAGLTVSPRTVRSESDPTYCDDYSWQEIIYYGGCGNSSPGGDNGYDCKGTFWQTGTQDGHWLEVYGGTCFYFSYSCWEDGPSYHLYYENCSGQWVSRTASEFQNCQCYE